MQIELKKISYMVRNSEETPCYAAQVWVDGLHVADVSNDGHGGPDRQYLVNGELQTTLAALDLRIQAARPAIDMSEYGMNPIPADLEHESHRLLEEFLKSRDLKRAMNRKVMFVANGQVREWGMKGKMKLSPADVQRLVAVVMQRYPEAKVLNLLPFEEALGLFH
jgi:hypothetical protein